MAREEVDHVRGLTSEEARDRLLEAGPNRLVEEKRVTFLAIFWEEVREPMIFLLIVVAVFYSVWGQLRDVITILVVITLLILAEVTNEFRAKRAIDALGKLASPLATVIRDGRVQEIATSSIVPGDVVLLRVGERVPADAKLIDAAGLEVDESTMTGESVPVSKSAGASVPVGASLSDRTNEVFAGTVIVRGKASGLVSATGMDTELGRIAGLTRAVKEPRTRLQTAMRQLAGWLVWVAVSLSIIIPLVGILQGRPYKEMTLTGLGLAFATVPEELPIIITMVLGLGAFQLSRKNALVKRLRAAETLGGVTVIATDKTGTLTENRMLLSSVTAGGVTSDVSEGIAGAAAMRVLEIGVMLNDLTRKNDDGGFTYAGDPMEIAMLEGAQKAGQDPDEIAGRLRIVEEFGFDTDRKVMSAVMEREGRREIFLKGAPEAVLARSRVILVEGEGKELTGEGRDKVRGKVEEMARAGLRVIAFASKDIGVGREISRDEAETDLTFVGTAGFLDPPRRDSSLAVRECGDAGIRVMMITGDHPLTAGAIARNVGLDSADRLVTGTELDRIDDEDLTRIVGETSVFARATPEHKLRIVRALRGAGEIVAVTGDGVNDAPALREADIGVAMGETGTDVAREAADMILTDDNFATITYAVREGRKLFDNLRKGVRYYLAVKLGLVLVFLLPTALGIPLPFAPIQIILLELFMDLAASATFVAEPDERDVMSRPPRNPSGKFMDSLMLEGIVVGGLALFGAVNTVYLVSYYSIASAPVARSAAFATWIIGHVALAFSMRSERESIVSTVLLSNRVMILWAVVALGFLGLAVNVPAMQSSLKLASLSGNLWLFAAGAAIGAAAVMEIFKLIMKRSRKNL